MVSLMQACSLLQCVCFSLHIQLLTSGAVWSLICVPIAELSTVLSFMNRVVVEAFSVGVAQDVGSEGVDVSQKSRHSAKQPKRTSALRLPCVSGPGRSYTINMN